MKIWEQIKASTDAAEIEKLEKQYNHTLKRTVEEQDRIEAEKVFAQPNLL